MTLRFPKKLSANLVARIFVAVAAALSFLSASLAIPSLADGDFSQGLLLCGVAVFSGWMATAIHQFQHRLSAIDEVVRQGKRRVEQSDLILEEMRKLARSLRSSSRVDENEEDRTVH